MSSVSSTSSSPAPSRPLLPLPPSVLPSYLVDQPHLSGYPPELFDEAQLDSHQDLICSVCASVCRAAVSCPTDCAALFCSACLHQCLNENGRCPACRTAIARNSLAINSYVQKVIRGLAVVCPNKCGKTGLVLGVGERSLKEHLTLQCTHRAVPCEFRCGATLSLQAAAAHNATCPLLPVLCSNGCSTQQSGQYACRHLPGELCKPTVLPKQSMPAHVADKCPATRGRCSLCLVTTKRCEWAAHVQSGEHQRSEAEAIVAALSEYATSLIRKAYPHTSEASSEFSKLQAFMTLPPVTAAAAGATECGISSFALSALSAAFSPPVCTSSSLKTDRSAPKARGRKRKQRTAETESDREGEAEAAEASAAPVPRHRVGGQWLREESSRDVVHGWRVGDLLDVRSGVGWSDAIVVAVDSTRQHVIVHFSGWSKMFDESIAGGSRRLAPSRSMSRTHLTRKEAEREDEQEFIPRAAPPTAFSHAAAAQEEDQAAEGERCACYH